MNSAFAKSFAVRPYVEFSRSSPHFDVTPPTERLGVLFHHSVMSFEETVDFMCGPNSEVSYHCLIAPDGRRCTMVADEHRAWHAGASTFLGRVRCNDFLLGLAFAGDTYVEPLSDLQLDSALEWLEPKARITLPTNGTGDSDGCALWFAAGRASVLDDLRAELRRQKDES